MHATIASLRAGGIARFPSLNSFAYDSFAFKHFVRYRHANTSKMGYPQQMPNQSPDDSGFRELCRKFHARFRPSLRPRLVNRPILNIFLRRQRKSRLDAPRLRNSLRHVLPQRRSVLESMPRPAARNPHIFEIGMPVNQKIPARSIFVLADARFHQRRILQRRKSLPQIRARLVQFFGRTPAAPAYPDRRAARDRRTPL